jgi:hypothetical protein
MTKKSFYQQNHDERQRIHDDKMLIESERGWAGQHGQHPETAEEESYRPHTPVHNLKPDFNPGAETIDPA